MLKLCPNGNEAPELGVQCVVSVSELIPALTLSQCPQYGRQLVEN